MKIAIVQIRGIIGTDRKVRDTLQFLNLGKPNKVTIVEDTPNIAGMLRKVEPFITWGPVDDKTRAFCLSRVGKVYTRKEIDCIDLSFDLRTLQPCAC